MFTVYTYTYIYIYIYTIFSASVAATSPNVPLLPCNTWQQNTVYDGVDYVLILSHPSKPPEFVLGLFVFLFFVYFQPQARTAPAAVPSFPVHSLIPLTRVRPRPFLIRRYTTRAFAITRICW